MGTDILRAIKVWVILSKNGNFESWFWGNVFMPSIHTLFRDNKPLMDTFFLNGFPAIPIDCALDPSGQLRTVLEQMIQVRDSQYWCDEVDSTPATDHTVLCRQKLKFRIAQTYLSSFVDYVVQTIKPLGATFEYASYRGERSTEFKSPFLQNFRGNIICISNFTRKVMPTRLIVPLCESININLLCGERYGV